MEVKKINENSYVCRVRVECGLSNQRVIDATGRLTSVQSAVVKTMPRGKGGVVDVIFIRLSPGEHANPNLITDSEFEAACARRNFDAAPVDEVAAVNTVDPVFADDKPNFTQWKNEDGQRCYAAFDRWGAGPGITVQCAGGSWSTNWWIACKARLAPETSSS